MSSDCGFEHLLRQGVLPQTTFASSSMPAAGSAALSVLAVGARQSCSRHVTGRWRRTGRGIARFGARCPQLHGSRSRPAPRYLRSVPAKPSSPGLEARRIRALSQIHSSRRTLMKQKMMCVLAVLMLSIGTSLAMAQDCCPKPDCCKPGSGCCHKHNNNK